MYSSLLNISRDYENSRAGRKLLADWIRSVDWQLNTPDRYRLPTRRSPSDQRNAHTAARPASGAQRTSPGRGRCHLGQTRRAVCEARALAPCCSVGPGPHRTPTQSPLPGTLGHTKCTPTPTRLLPGPSPCTEPGCHGACFLVSSGPCSDGSSLGGQGLVCLPLHCQCPEQCLA